jgi:predicted nucleic acid-binding protein
VILVDTSVWVAHFRRRLADLAELLERQQVLTHAFVVGELACGTLHQRAIILQLLKELPQAVPASHDEVLDMIDQRRLWGTGLGWLDCHLLASALLTPCRLWTTDRRLGQAASQFKVGWP